MDRKQKLRWPRLAGLLLLSWLPAALSAECPIFARTNLMAWCIVPFDAKKRGPEERAAMMAQLGFKHNQHHGHDHLERFAALLAQMKPYLLGLNLNGMTRDGDKVGKKILPLGQGDLDLGLLKVICDSGWRGPVGILNHTEEDAEARLRDNLDGLDWLLPQLDGKAAGPKPKPRSWREPDPPAAPRKSAASGD